MGIAIVIRITMMVITTISSTKVKPSRRRLLVLGIRCSRGVFFGCLAIYIKHILASPTGGFGIVLVASHAPLRSAGKRVPGDLTQELHLFAVRSIQLLPFHQDF